MSLFLKCLSLQKSRIYPIQTVYRLHALAHYGYSSTLHSVQYFAINQKWVCGGNKGIFKKIRKIKSQTRVKAQQEGSVHY